MASRTLLSSPAGAPAWFAAFVGQLNRFLTLRTRPGSPERLYDVDQPSDLPPAGDHQACSVWVTSLSRIAVSDGAHWLRQDTGATL